MAFSFVRKGASENGATRPRRGLGRAPASHEDPPMGRSYGPEAETRLRTSSSQDSGATDVWFVVPSVSEGPLPYRRTLPRPCLLLASAVRRAGFRPRVFDGYSFPGMPRLLLREARTHSPRMLALSVHGPQALASGVQLARQMHALAPSTPIVMGGQFIRVDLLETLRTQLPNYIELASGPHALANFLQLLGSPPNAAIAEVTLPDFTALDVRTPLAKYNQHEFEYHLDSSRGCPFSCEHCGTDRSFRRRSIEDFTRELDLVVDAFAGMSLPDLWVTDETFTLDLQHAHAVCRALSSRGRQFRWRAQTRADRCGDFTILQDMKAAGCHSIAFGVEIPEDYGLGALKKGETLAQMHSAFMAAKAVGLRTEAILMVGFPGDPTDFTCWRRAIEELQPDSIQPYIYHPIPGSPWWQSHGTGLVKSLLRASEQWRLLDFHRPPVFGTIQERDSVVGKFLLLMALMEDPASSARTELPEWLRFLRKAVCGGCGAVTEFTSAYWGHAAVVLQTRGQSASVHLCFSGGRCLRYVYDWAAPGNLFEDVRVLEETPDPTEIGTLLCAQCACTFGDGGHLNAARETAVLT